MKNIKNIEPEYLLLKKNLWQSYANVEAEMAIAQSQVGIIPKQAAIIIKKKSNFSKKNFTEVEKLQKKNKKTILSIVKVLSKKSGEFGGYVHWGGTTRNIIDTGNKLIFRENYGIFILWLGLGISSASFLTRIRK